MNILAMKRFWLALSLPALVGLLGGKSGLILAGIIWLPVSAVLFTWAFSTCQRNKKAAIKVDNSTRNRFSNASSKQSKSGSYLIAFLKMKRLWIAVAIPSIILYRDGIGGYSIFWSAGLLWMPVSAILFFTALNSSMLRTSNRATVDNFNDNNDGCYSHTLFHSSMHIDSRKQKITLKDGNNEKIYSFDDIKSWRYNISHGNTIEGAGLSLTTANINNMRTAENRARTGFFIKLRDIQSPEWQIHFFPKEGSFKSQKGIKDLEKQMNHWMEVFDQIINKNNG